MCPVILAEARIQASPYPAWIPCLHAKVRYGTQACQARNDKYLRDCFASRLPKNLFGEQVGSQ